MEFQEIGIVDTRNIIKALKEHYDLDFSEFALTSFKRRIEGVMVNNGLKSPDALIKKIETQKDYKDQFLRDIAIETTEMFRDPSLWRWLRDEFFNGKVISSIDNLRIWLPECVSGEELYSLCIVIHECNMAEKVHVSASTSSSRNIDQIKTGKMWHKKLEVSSENYKRYMGYEGLSKYFTRYELENPQRDPELIKNVEFIHHNILNDNLPGNNDLVLYRNRFIYFNPGLQSKMMSRIYDTMKKGGVLSLGVQEKLDSGFTEKFAVLNKAENVFRKK